MYIVLAVTRRYTETLVLPTAPLCGHKVVLCDGEPLIGGRCPYHEYGGRMTRLDDNGWRVKVTDARLERRTWPTEGYKTYYAEVLGCDRNIEEWTRLARELGMPPKFKKIRGVI
jgi:hypothetical protein